MSDFNFDDELPPWLSDDADDNPKSSDDDKKGGAAGQTGNLPWNAQANDSGDKPDSNRLGVTGQLPWRAEVGEDQPAASGDDLANLDWESAKTADNQAPQRDSLKGLTGNLPWNAQASDPASAPPDDLSAWLDANESASEPAAEDAPFAFDFDAPDDSELEAPFDFEAAEADSPSEPSFDDEVFGFADSDIEPADLPDWLASSADAAEPAAETPLSFEGFSEADDEPLEMPAWMDGLSADDEDEPLEMPDWMDEEAEDEPAEALAAADVPDWLRTDTSTFVESSAEAVGDEAASFSDWANETETVDDLNWLSDEPVYTDDGEGLTYEEWERRNQEVEALSSAPPEIPLPDDLPDMSELPPDLPGSGPLPQSGDYMPDWFMGVEELDDSAAPDWLKGSNLGSKGSAPLTPPPPVEPPPSFSMDDALPDLDMMLGSRPADDLPLPDFDAPSFFESDIDDIPLPDFDDAPAEPAPRASGIRRLPTASASLDDAAVELDDLLGDLAIDDDLALELPQTGDLNLPLGFDEEPNFDEINFVAPPDLDFGDPLPSSAPRTARSDDPFDLDSLFGGSTDPRLPQADLESLSSAESFDDSFDDDFLAGIAPSQPSKPSEASPQQAHIDDEAHELAEAELPEWARQRIDTSRTGDDYLLAIGGLQKPLAEVPYVVLPPELQELREASARILEESQAAGFVVQAGMLAGIDGVLRIEPELVTPRELNSAKGFDLSVEQRDRLLSLERVLKSMQEESARNQIDVSFGVEREREPDPDLVAAPAAPKPKARRRTKIAWDRLPIMLLLFLAVLLPFLSEALHLAETPTELPESALPLAAAVDALGPPAFNTEAPLVLFAFEYGPTAAYELDPLAEAVLRDVLIHGGKPIIVSTSPLGAAQARHVLAKLTDDLPLMNALGREIIYPSTRPINPFLDAKVGYRLPIHAQNRNLIETIRPTPEPPILPRLNSPEDYVILGYLPGGAMGVRSLALSDGGNVTRFRQDVNGDDTGLDISQISSENFAFVVVLAESYQESRAWAEQFSSVDLPKFALLSAAAAPLTQPYTESGAYAAQLSGVQTTITYNNLRNALTLTPYEAPENLNIPDPNTSWLHSLALAALIAALLIILGALINVVRNLSRALYNARSRRRA